MLSHNNVKYFKFYDVANATLTLKKLISENGFDVEELKAFINRHKVKILDLSHCSLGNNHANQIAHLLSSVPNLIQVNLSYNNFSDIGIAIIAKSCRAPTLHLSGNDTRYTGALALAKNKRLREIDVSLNRHFDNECIIALLENKNLNVLYLREIYYISIKAIHAIAKHPNLSVLDISKNNLNDYAALVLSQSKSITQIIANNNYFGAIGFAALVENMQLTHLMLSTNTINITIINLIKTNQSITSLDLSWHTTDTFLKRHGVALLVDKFPNLTHLTLRFCCLEDNVINILATHPKLTHLDLHANDITDAGVKTLTQSKTIKMLNLGKNYKLTRQSLNILAKNTILEELYFADSSLGDMSAIALKDTTIKRLDLNNNYISDTGIIALSRNENLRSLRLNRNKFTDLGAEALAANTTCEIIEAEDVALGIKGKVAMQTTNPIKCINYKLKSSDAVQITAPSLYHLCLFKVRSQALWNDECLKAVENNLPTAIQEDLSLHEKKRYSVPFPRGTT